MSRHLQGISEGMQSAAASIMAVSETSVRQADGLDQIDKAVQLIDQVTGANTAGAEESAAAAEELAEQARRLEDLVGLFRLADTPARVRDDALVPKW